MGYLLNLDDPGPQWLPPVDYKPSDRCTPKITGLAQYLPVIKPVSTTGAQPSTAPTRTKLQIETKERKERSQRQREDFQRQFQEWKNKAKSSAYKGDPHCTVILARLSYSTTSEEIGSAMSRYGPVESIRIIKNGDKPRGYAFVLFQDPSSARQAVESNGGELLLGGTRVIIDIERERLQRGWKPRRLGGGEGGRFTIARQKAEIARHENILRHELHLPSTNYNKDRSRERDQLRDRRFVPKRPYHPNSRDGDYRGSRVSASDEFYGPKLSFDHRETNNNNNNNNKRNATDASSNANANANANGNTVNRGSGRQLRQY